MIQLIPTMKPFTTFTSAARLWAGIQQFTKHMAVGLALLLALHATNLVAQTTVVLPKSCKGCPLSTNGTGDITSYDNCNVVTSGTLTAGTPASAVTQTIAVTVGKLGTYNLSAIANGVIFSASGSFTTVGAQNLVLTATGTPLAAGANTYTLNTTPTCSFSRTTVAGTSVVTAIGTLAPCPGAFANVLSFGMQRTVGIHDGYPGDDATANYGNMFLSADGTTLYDTRGFYHDLNNRAAIVANINSAGAGSGAKGLNAVVPVQAVRQVFPGVTFKQFSHIEAGNTGYGRYLFLLTNTDDLYAMILVPSSPGVGYMPFLGPTLGLATAPASGTALNAAYYRTAQLNPVGMKFSSFWHGMSDVTANTMMFAYNSIDNQVYSWGGIYDATSNTKGPASANMLLRTAPATALASVTPSPATVINTILQRNGTTLKEMTDSDVTFMVGAVNPVEYTQAQSNAVFIGKDGKVYRYFYTNQKNYKISLPGAVKAVSVMSTVTQYATKLIVILGDDGKLYTDNIFPSISVNSSTFLPTTNDQPITATKHNSTAQVDALNVVQIYSPWNTGSDYSQSIGALTSDGTLYRIFDDTPYTGTNNFSIIPVSTALIDITQRDGLPLFSKIFACEARSALNPQVIGRSKTTGNTIAAVTASTVANIMATASANTSQGFSGHFSDTGAFLYSTTILQYLWFNCLDPWSN